MFVESLAILAIIIVLAVMVARRGKRQFLAFVLPLISIPVLHIVAYLLDFSRFYFDLAGLVVAVVLCVVFSFGLTERKHKIGYIAYNLVFVAALFISFQINQGHF